MSKGYYSCAQTCDFDLCKKCAADPQGNLLTKQVGMPDKYTLGAVQCDLCEKIISSKEIESGFLHSSKGGYDVCRKCVPCAPHTWKQNVQPNKNVEASQIKAKDPYLGNRGPFLTPTFVDCASSPLEAFLVGCFLDIPYKAIGEHIYLPDEQRGVTIKAGSNLILYKKEIQETDIALKNDLLVIHRYNEMGN